MELFAKIIDRITDTSGFIAGALMLLGVAFVMIEVILRSFFDSTIYVSEEYTAYLLVAISFFSLAYTLKDKGHIRVNFLFKLVKGTNGPFFIDIFAFTVGFLIFAVITVITFNFFWDSVMMGTQSLQITRTYLAVPQSVIPLGSLFITLQFAAEICKTILKLREGEEHEIGSESEAIGR